MAEYLGGVLAGCRTPDGRDDRAVVWSGLITRLSSFQVRAHFLLYREWVDRLAATKLDLGQDRSLATMYVDLDEFKLALMQGAELDTDAVLLHTTTGLAANDLIDDTWIFGETSKMLGAQQQCSFTNALRVHPTITGVELFGWAQGLPGLTVDEWTSQPSIVNPDEAMPRLKGVVLLQVSAMLESRRTQAAEAARQEHGSLTRLRMSPNSTEHSSQRHSGQSPRSELVASLGRARASWLPTTRSSRTSQRTLRTLSGRARCESEMFERD